MKFRFALRRAEEDCWETARSSEGADMAGVPLEGDIVVAVVMMEERVRLRLRWEFARESVGFW